MDTTGVDYPAAHSMDTEWFAIDRDGHVGVFITGEEGHAPDRINSYDPGSAPLDLLDWYLPPDASAGLNQYSADRVPVELVRLGVFYFFYEQYDAEQDGPPDETVEFPLPGLHVLSYRNFIYPYTRDCLPASLLHVDQLPPELRKRARRHRLAGVSFAEQEFVQPAEHFPCTGWGYSQHRAYLCGDGRTFRPTPGRESVFAQFRREFLAADSRWAGWFIFDGPTCNSHDSPG